METTITISIAILTSLFAIALSKPDFYIKYVSLKIFLLILLLAFMAFSYELGLTLAELSLPDSLDKATKKVIVDAIKSYEIPRACITIGLVSIISNFIFESLSKSLIKHQKNVS
ncbi:hypothetical protein DL796_03635 [Kangiella spongicola]|uniref:Uncharacterized protein n=1 Tax=Kangiella spongicola TaxID=796379 RepID=A0A318DDL8_9GAMM|nr:hypothetical protein DL796_03635 [Kangiella spongicola]